VYHGRGANKAPLFLLKKNQKVIKVASYKVIRKGFHDGELYEPNGKRNTLTIEVPFKKVPGWLVRVKDIEVNQAEEEEKALADKAKQESDRIEIEEVSFIGKIKNAVKTL
jgi:hypothetical protein